MGCAIDKSYSMHALMLILCSKQTKHKLYKLSADFGLFTKQSNATLATLRNHFQR